MNDTLAPLWLNFGSFVETLAHGSSNGLGGAWWGELASWLAMATLLLVGLSAKLLSTWTLRSLLQTNIRTTTIAHGYIWGRRLHFGLWSLCASLTSFAGDWLQLLIAPRSSGLGQTVMCLMRYGGIIVAPWILSWAAFYEVEQHFIRPNNGPIARWQFVWHKCRYYFGTTLLPLLLGLLWSRFFEALLPTEQRTDVTQVVNLVGLLILAAVFPAMLAHIWPTEPLRDIAQRDRLLEFAERHGESVRSIRVWQTHGTQCNAAVAGMIRPWRYVLLSDLLLARLTNQELLAAYAHEVGHLRHRHVAARMLWILAPLGWWCLTRASLREASLQWPELRSLAGAYQVASSGRPLYEAGASLVPLCALVLYLVVGFGWLARRLELQADSWAVDQLRLEWGEVAAIAIYRSMLGKLAKNVAGECHEQSRSWLHPSLAERMAHVDRQRVEGPPTESPDRSLGACARDFRPAEAPTRPTRNEICWWGWLAIIAMVPLAGWGMLTIP